MIETRAESIWANALADPLRVRALRELLRGTASPVELARRCEVAPAALRPHLRRLIGLGVIERDERPMAERNAYRLCDRPATEEALWRLGAPVPARELAMRFAVRMSAVTQSRASTVERLRARREQLGFSLPRLARRAGLRPDLLGRIERGQADPRLSVVLVLAEELDYPLEQLFGPAERQAEDCR